MVPTAAASSLVPAAPLVTERVGRYRLLHRLGSGGMATVFLARSEGLGGFERDVAVKLLHEHLRENADMALQLVNEARISAKIRHPNVVPVHDVVEDPSGIFLVMEYVEGDTLSGLQRAAKAAGQPLPIPIALRILTDALAGLHGAHELRDDDGHRLEIVHRDFSPQNILVGTDGIARLTDFGIAKVASGAGHTRPGFIKGKVGYMSPEQARGKPVDRRCDVWAAGVIAWELLAGRPLRGGDDEMATLLEVVSAVPPDVRTVAPNVSAALAEVVASALTPELSQRCLSAEVLRRRLLDVARAEGALADHADVAAFVKQHGRPVRNTPLPASVSRQDGGRASLTGLSFSPVTPVQPPHVLFEADRRASSTATLPSLARPAFEVPPVVSPRTGPARSSRRWWSLAPVAAVAALVATVLVVRRSAAPVAADVLAVAHPLLAVAPSHSASTVVPDSVPSLVPPTSLAEAAAAGSTADKPRPLSSARVRVKRDAGRAGRPRVRQTIVAPTPARRGRDVSAPAPKVPPPLAGNPYAAGR
ncbi:MAG TPA: serine/threonine-protein kinase [Polyangia bacterium]